MLCQYPFIIVVTTTIPFCGEINKAAPDRVHIIQQRKKHLHAIIEKINNRIGNNTMRFFPDLTAFQQVYPDGNFIDWKIYQSVAAELYAHDLERLC